MIESLLQLVGIALIGIVFASLISKMTSAQMVEKFFQLEEARQEARARRALRWAWPHKITNPSEGVDKIFGRMTQDEGREMLRLLLHFADEKWLDQNGLTAADQAKMMDRLQEGQRRVDSMERGYPLPT